MKVRGRNDSTTELLGAGNFETPAEAYDFAAEIAAEHKQRVRLFPVGRGLAGQLMWDVVHVARSADAAPVCEHPSWSEEGDGHGHNYWQCTGCGTTRWIAPWVTGEFR